MPTLREILDWEILSGHSVINGAEALEANVLSVTVIDAPDAVNWVKAHEFVVTSTYPVQQSPDALMILIEQLAARNAAGLGVKLTRYLREVPDNARSRAEELNFPVISLPGQLAWSDLIGRVFADDGRQRMGSAYLSAIYRGFSQHRAAINSVRELFELVAGFVNLPLIIAMEDEAGLHTESRGVTAPEAERLAETLIHGLALDPRLDDKPTRHTIDGETVSVARSAFGRNGGGVVAVVERGQRVSEPDLECLRLSVHLLQRLIDAKSGEHADLARHATLLDNLFDPLLASEAKELLASHRPSPTKAWYMVVAQVFDRDTVDQALLVLRLRQFCRRRLALLRPADDGSEFIVAVPATDFNSSSEEAALRELHHIFEQLAQRAPNFRYGLGQSGPAPLSEAIPLRREAKDAMSFGTKLNGFNRMGRHDDLQVLRLLAHPAVIEESRTSFLRLLQPLLALGEQGTTLIETLRVWLREDESIPRTAELLGLHVNTVRQRLDRCKSHLGLANFKTDTRLRLYAALQLLSILLPEGD